MRFFNSFILGIASVVAFDNLFFDEPSDSNLNLEIGTDSNLNLPWSTSVDESSNLYQDGPSDATSNVIDFPNDGDSWDLSLDNDQAFPDLVADEINGCSPEPQAASKRRRRRSTECKVKEPAADVSPDLSVVVQQKLFRGLVCPSSSPDEAP